MSIMLMSLVFTVLLVHYAALKKPEGEKNIRGKGLRLGNLKAKIRKENGKAVFPQDIDGDLEIDGLPGRNMKAKLLRGVRQPSSLQSDGKSAKQLRSEEKEKAYYVGPDMAFVTSVKERNGRYEEEMFGFVREGNQNCVWKKNKKVGARAFCSEVVEGDDVMLEPITGKKVERTEKRGGRRKRQQRVRRQSADILGETKVVKNVVFCAKSFVDRFKAINDGDYDMAVEDIKEYVTCLSNEWTYGFQTLLANAGYSLAIDTIEVIVPPDGADFDFIRKDSRGHIMFDTLGLFGQNHLVRQNTDFNNGLAHHATLLVGDPIGDGTLGIAYLGTICHPYADGYRVDMTVDLDWNAALVGVHELGHSMGAGHDGYDNGCASASYLMAAYAFSPTLVTKDTAFTFSPCTANEITNHISMVDPHGTCLADTDTDFLNDFCLGPRGRMSGSSIHDQCERLAAGYTACGDIMKVTTDQCWQYNSVWCCNGGTYRTIQHIAEGTPCLGQDPTQESFCYRGGCVQGETICGTL